MTLVHAISGATDAACSAAYAAADEALAQRGKSFHWARRLLSAPLGLTSPLGITSPLGNSAGPAPAGERPLRPEDVSTLAALVAAQWKEAGFPKIVLFTG